MTRKREAGEDAAIRDSRIPQARRRAYRLTIYWGDNKRHGAADAGAEQHEKRCDQAGKDSVRRRPARRWPFGRARRGDRAYRAVNGLLWHRRAGSGSTIEKTRR